MARVDGRVCAPVVGHRAMVVDFRGDDGVLTSDKRGMLPVTDEPVLVGLPGAFYLSFSVKVRVGHGWQTGALPGADEGRLVGFRGLFICPFR